MDPLSNPALIIFSALSPLLIAFIKQSGFPQSVNAIIALVCYVIVGIAGAVLSGEELTVENAVALIAVATTIGTVAYQLIWSNVGEEALTVRTSFIKSTDGVPDSDEP